MNTKEFLCNENFFVNGEISHRDINLCTEWSMQLALTLSSTRRAAACMFLMRKVSTIGATEVGPLFFGPGSNLY